MSAPTRALRFRPAAALAGLALALTPAAALASDDAPTEPMAIEGTQNAIGQAVQIRVNADGTQNGHKTNFRWSATQVSAQGDPNNDIQVRVPEQGQLLHNLQTFGRIPQESGQAIFDISLDDVGFGTARSVSLFPQDLALPVELSTKFTLDGQPVTAQDLVGATGTVTAAYTITNKTAKEMDVPITSVTGDKTTKTVDNAMVPMVVEATTLLPTRFSALNTGHGLAGADGRGNWLVKWIALPFAPLSPRGTATFGWAAQVRDGVLPSMIIQVMPLYIPPHVQGDQTPAASGGGGSSGSSVPPPDVSGDLAQAKSGLEQVISGIETLTADDGGEDPLTTIQDSINQFFDEFAANFKAIADLTDPNNEDSITAQLRQLQSAVDDLRTALAKYDTSQIPEAVETIDAQFDDIIASVEALLSALTDEIPGPDTPASWCKVLVPILQQIPSDITQESCQKALGDLQNIVTNEDQVQGAINTLNNALNQIDGAVAVLSPLLGSIATLLSDVDQKMLALNEQMTVLSTALQEKEIDLPTVDQVVAELTAKVVSSPGGQQITAGMDQLQAGLGGAKAEIASWAAAMAVQVSAAVSEAKKALESGKDAAAVAVEKADGLKASVAGMVTAAGQSPLPYGGDPADAPEGTVLSGAYEYRVDAADTEHPSTLPRLAIGLILLLGGGIIGNLIARRRRSPDAGVAVVAGGAGSAGAAATEDVPEGWASFSEQEARRRADAGTAGGSTGALDDTTQTSAFDAVSGDASDVGDDVPVVGPSAADQAPESVEQSSEAVREPGDDPEASAGRD